MNTFYNKWAIVTKNSIFCMAETIITGYLFKKIDYGIFDEIISFIDTKGQKYTCLSKGSRKIASKNARNLFIGNLIEFQIFQARSDDKVSRLKKANTITNENWNLPILTSFQLLNECIDKTQSTDEQLCQFYKNNLDIIKKNQYDLDTTILIILHRFCLLIGLGLQTSQCVNCGAHKLKTISFKHHGMLCAVCAESLQADIYDLELSKLIFCVFKEQYDQISQFYSQHKFAIKLLKTYINDNAGILLNALVEY
jgi:DNA repair protein RecO (recombination protein O)